jgi:hypothetical protein
MLLGEDVLDCLFWNHVSLSLVWWYNYNNFAHTIRQGERGPTVYDYWSPCNGVVSWLHVLLLSKHKRSFCMNLTGIFIVSSIHWFQSKHGKAIPLSGREGPQKYERLRLRAIMRVQELGQLKNRMTSSGFGSRITTSFLWWILSSAVAPYNVQAKLGLNSIKCFVFLQRLCKHCSFHLQG